MPYWSNIFVTRESLHQWQVNQTGLLPALYFAYNKLSSCLHPDVIISYHLQLSTMAKATSAHFSGGFQFPPEMCSCFLSPLLTALFQGTYDADHHKKAPLLLLKVHLTFLQIYFLHIPKNGCPVYWTILCNSRDQCCGFSHSAVRHTENTSSLL